MKKNRNIKGERKDGPACGECRFWVQIYDGSEKPIRGECHRFPPVMQRVPSREYLALFPAIYETVSNWSTPQPNDWCGEFVDGKASHE